MGLRSGAGMFCCMCLLFGRCPSDLEIVLGFWRTTLWINCCFVLFQEKPSFQVKFHAGKLPSWHQSPGAHHGVGGHFAGVWRRSDGDFSSSHWWLSAPFPGSSLLVTVTVMAPELLLLMLSHISSFKFLDYMYLNIITVDFIALWDKVRENENQWGKWPFLCCSGKTLFFLRIIYENPGQIMQLFLSISTSSSWEHYQ